MRTRPTGKPPDHAGHPPAERGTILIIVLWVSLGLVTVTLLFGHSMMLNFRGADHHLAAIQSQPIAEDLPVGEHVARILAAAMSAMRHGPELFRLLEQVPDAALRKRLADARRSVTEFIGQLLEAHREELRVGDLELAAFMVVSAAEGVGGNASRELFEDRLGAELGAMLSRYLTG